MKATQDPVAGTPSPDRPDRCGGEAAPAAFETERVLPDLHAWQQAGHRTALITLVDIEGSAPRPLGAQMAVCECGESRGFISGGCLEPSLVAEAQAAIAEGRNRLVRYGHGSKYVDIVLPCGSAIDLYFDVSLDKTVVEDAAAREARRNPFILATDLTSGASRIEPAADGGPALIAKRKADIFHRPYRPRLRLTIAGKGPATVCLARLAVASNVECAVFSPETETLAFCRAAGAQTHHLTMPEEPVDLPGDAWTAFVLLFHEHEWEPPLLQTAVGGPYFYVGALGSRRTHETRLQALKARGLSDVQLGRIKGPLGLFPQARSPMEIAVSVLADVVHAYGLRYPA